MCAQNFRKIVFDFCKLVVVNLRSSVELRELELKQIFIAFVASSAFALNLVASEAILVESLPVPVFCDTEVTTNFLFNPTAQKAEKFAIDLQFVGTVTNNIEIGVGRDMNCDGVLDPEETALLFGWRSGRYFVEDVVAEIRTFGRSQSEHENIRFFRMTFTGERGGTSVGSVPETDEDVGLGARPLAWDSRNRLNIMRVTRRGCSHAEERCYVEGKYSSFCIIIK